MKGISTYGYTNIGDRKENEDTGSICQYKKNIVAVVADGLGGQGDGKAASELAVLALTKCGSMDGFPSRQEVEEAFQAANEAVLKKQKNSFHMKTTAVYLCLQSSRAIWAHVGDSRLYHFYNGDLCHYTLDHSIPQVEAALGNITREEIADHPRRSSLLRALGCEDEEAEVHEEVELQAGSHAFLLCTDGFWEHLTDEEIREALGSSRSAQEWVQILSGKIQSSGKEDRDNNTAAAILLEV